MEVWVLVFGFFTFLSVVSRVVPSIRRQRHIYWEAWEDRLGVLVRNLKTMKMVYWVNVSESSATKSPGVSPGYMAVERFDTILLCLPM